MFREFRNMVEKSGKDATLWGVTQLLLKSKIIFVQWGSTQIRKSESNLEKYI